MSTTAEHIADREVLYSALGLDPEEQHDPLAAAINLLHIYGYNPDDL